MRYGDMESLAWQAKLINVCLEEVDSYVLVIKSAFNGHLCRYCNTVQTCECKYLDLSDFERGISVEVAKLPSHMKCRVGQPNSESQQRRRQKTARWNGAVHHRHLETARFLDSHSADLETNQSKD